MLKDLKLIPSYDTNTNNVIKEFYNVVLAEAKRYYRISAYFTASSISNMADGIAKFYCNDGKMKLIISHDIDKNDFELLKQGYYEKLDSINQNIIDNFNYDELSDEQKRKIANVAFLIAQNALEVKIAFKHPGIFHDKFGIIENDLLDECEYVYFKGSNNETLAAVENNYESFDITCSWLASDFEKKKVDMAKKRFDDIWNNRVDDMIVLDIPNVVKNNLLKYNNKKLYYDYDSDKTIILDYSKNNSRLELLIGDNIYFNDKNPKFKMYLKMYVDSIEEKKICFKKDVPYGKYNYIYNKLKEYADYEIEKGRFVQFEISKNYYDYLKEVDYKIEERSKLGSFIKEENLIGNDEIQRSFLEFKEILNFEMERKLRDKQIWNAFHMVKMKRAANFSVPGAGKTSIVYGAYAYLNSSKVNECNKIVVIGPKSCFASWKDEFKENFGDNKELKVCSINEIDKKNLISDAVNKNLILINYESLPGIKNNLIKIIDKKTLLVFDEIHKIKGIDKVRSNVALEICEKPKYKIALTGTPIPNGYEDIYNMLNILYKNEYDYFFGFEINLLRNPLINDINDINQKLYPFFCRIKKSDLNIPKPNEDRLIEIHCSENERLLFEEIKRIYKGDVFTYYIRMMQAMNNPKLLLEDIKYNDVKDIFIDDLDENSSISTDIPAYNSNTISNERLIELINAIDTTQKFNRGIDEIVRLVEEEKQVLVWGLFTSTLNLIKKRLAEKCIRCEIVNGEVSSLEEREKIINRFKNKEINVLISNPNTLAESVSLHKQCHDAVYFEYSFNLTHMLQSRDRINRLGLNDNDYTQYYYLVNEYTDNINKSIDMLIYSKLKYKEKRMIEAIENGELVSVKDTITNDILDLLNDN